MDEARPSKLPQRKRRRFQFRLRTLMIGVTLLCVVGGYVAIQARIVRHRKDLIDRLRDGSWSARFWLATDIEEALREMQRPATLATLTDPPRIPWVRERLGDFAVWLIFYKPSRVPANLLNEIKAYFPEAIIQRSDDSEALQSLRAGTLWIRQD